MLILSRRVGETVEVTVPPGAGGTMFISLVDIRRWKHSGSPQARLGFEGPKEFSIVRSELLEKENVCATPLPTS